jgi:rod shape-determining protein MreD
MDRAGLLMTGRVLSSITPVACGLVCSLTSNFPISFTGGTMPPPLLALMPVYFWGLVRPDLMTPGWAFVIGLVEDIFSGGPPGVWTASFVATYALIDRQRDVFAGFSGIGAMLGFATAAVTTYLTAYLIVSLYHGQLGLVTPALGALAVTVLFYIPGAMVLGAIHRQIVGPLRSDF